MMASSRCPNFTRKVEELRSAINSSSVKKTSILADTARYIGELKKRIDELNNDTTVVHESKSSDEIVKVESLDEEGSVAISIDLENRSRTLFLSVLEVFEELGLEIEDADISCSPGFRFEASIHARALHARYGKESDVHVIKRAVMEAISKWSE